MRFSSSRLICNCSPSTIIAPGFASIRLEVLCLENWRLNPWSVNEIPYRIALSTETACLRSESPCAASSYISRKDSAIVSRSVVARPKDDNLTTLPGKVPSVTSRVPYLLADFSGYLSLLESLTSCCSCGAGIEPKCLHA